MHYAHSNLYFFIHKVANLWFVCCCCCCCRCCCLDSREMFEYVCFRWNFMHWTCHWMLFSWYFSFVIRRFGVVFSVFHVWSLTEVCCVVPFICSSTHAHTFNLCLHNYYYTRGRAHKHTGCVKNNIKLNDQFDRHRRQTDACASPDDGLRAIWQWQNRYSHSPPTRQNTNTMHTSHRYAALPLPPLLLLFILQFYLWRFLFAC